MEHIVELDVAPNILPLLDRHEMPIRIQSPQTVYYILTLEQVLTLMGPTVTIEQEEAFTPEDFGLTEEDVNAYLEMRRKRQAHIDLSQQKPLTTDLQSCLNFAKDNSDGSTVDEQLMYELETAMLQNLQTLIPKAE